MSAIPRPKDWISPEDYLAAERVSEIRHEYVAGEVYAMAGASKRHNEIAANIHHWLRNALRGKPCRAFMENVKVRLPHLGETVFYYPDVFVSCDPRDTDEYFSDYPAAVFEVPSPETARLDEREKRWAYQTIETLETFVLVDQRTMRVTVWQHAGSGRDIFKDWQFEVLTSPGDQVKLPGLSLSIPLSEIYAGIEF